VWARPEFEHESHKYQLLFAGKPILHDVLPISKTYERNKLEEIDGPALLPYWATL